MTDLEKAKSLLPGRPVDRVSRNGRGIAAFNGPVLVAVFRETEGEWVCIGKPEEIEADRAAAAPRLNAGLV